MRWSPLSQSRFERERTFSSLSTQMRNSTTSASPGGRRPARGERVEGWSSLEAEDLPDDPIPVDCRRVMGL